MKQYPIDSGECEYADKNGKNLHRNMFNLEWLDNPKLVIEIGAYDFGDSIRLKQKFPECVVHSFELMPRNYQLYSPYAMSQGVLTYNIAISDKKGLVDFWESEHNTGVNAQSTLLEPDYQYSVNYGGYVKHRKITEQVWSESLYGFCTMRGVPNSIDLLMMDVEGAEGHVLRGLGHFRPKMIFAEFLLNTGGWKGQYSFESTLEYMKSIGYRLECELPFDKIFVYEG